MFSNTVASSNSSSVWNERAMPLRARLEGATREMSSPSSTTRPSAGAKPHTASISDVLPAPFGPISPVMVPGVSLKLTSFTATTAP